MRTKSLKWNRSLGRSGLGVSVDIGELVSADLQFHIYPHHSMFTLYQRQTKEKFKKFMESMLQKTGRLRSLVKELKTKFSEDDGAKEYLDPHVYIYNIYIYYIYYIIFVTLDICRW